MSKEGQSLNVFVNRMFEEYKITPGKTTEVGNALTAFLMSCYGSGLAFAPDSAFTSFYPLRRPVIATINNRSMSRNVVAAYNASIGLSVYTKAFIDITKEVADKEPNLQISSYRKE